MAGAATSFIVNWPLGSRNSAIDPLCHYQLDVIEPPIGIDLIHRVVERSGQPLHLTPIEYRFLTYLAAQPNRVVTSQQLLKVVWGPGHSDDIHYVRVHMANLRKKIEVDASMPKHVITEAGVGYRFVIDREKAKDDRSPSSPLRALAACAPAMMPALTPRSAIASKAASVVPPFEVTRSRSTLAASSDCAASLAAPSVVSINQQRQVVDDFDKTGTAAAWRSVHRMILVAAGDDDQGRERDQSLAMSVERGQLLLDDAFFRSGVERA